MEDRALGDLTRRNKPWTPRIWSGMHLPAWLRLLARNRYAVAWQRLPMAAMLTLFASTNTLLWMVQEAVFWRYLANVRLREDPVFILGHWRSGTTFLHELMSRDAQFIYPTTYQCLSPNHFLLSERVLAPLFSLFMPKQRLTDNMRMGVHLPQEDEFALCNMGHHSPFLTCAFPNRPPQDQEYFDLRQVPESDQLRWKRGFCKFLRQVSSKAPQKRLLIKSPQHTCRIGLLLEMFPDARFVYLVRHPRDVVASTIKLWKMMYRSQGLQVANYEGIEEYVLSTFQRFHQAVERDAESLPPDRFIVLRYEDLVQDPLSELRRIYEQLEIEDLEAAVPTIAEHVAAVADYRAGTYELSDDLEAAIVHHCQAFMARHGYDPVTVAVNS